MSIWEKKCSMPRKKGLKEERGKEEKKEGREGGKRGFYTCRIPEK